MDPLFTFDCFLLGKGEEKHGIYGFQKMRHLRENGMC